MDGVERRYGGYGVGEFVVYGNEGKRLLEQWAQARGLAAIPKYHPNHPIPSHASHHPSHPNLDDTYRLP